MSQTLELTEVQVGDIVRECKKLEQGMCRTLESFVLLKFRRGSILKDILRSQESYGEALVERIAKDIGVSDKTLYEEHAFARSRKYDEDALEDELSRLKTEGKRVSFNYFRKQLNPAKNPDVVGGMENHAEMTTQNIERLAQEIDAANEFHAENESVQGAIKVAYEVLSETPTLEIEKKDRLPINPLPRFKSPHYLRFVGTLECGVCHAPAPTDPHHVISKGRGGNNASDAKCIPLCRDCHDVVTKSIDTFEKDNHVDFGAIAWNTVEQYIRSHDNEGAA